MLKVFGHRHLSEKMKLLFYKLGVKNFRSEKKYEKFTGIGNEKDKWNFGVMQALDAKEASSVRVRRFDVTMLEIGSWNLNL